MNPQVDMLQLVVLSGWLALALTGFAAYRLNWKKSVVMALVWTAIFVGVAAIITLVEGSNSIGEAIGLSFL